VISYDVVIPTVGRASLGALFSALGAADGPLPRRILIVDDRPGDPESLDVRPPGGLAGRTVTVRGPARGPAAARNAGWRRSRAEWVAFLDDDVIPGPGWRAELARDLARAAPDVAGVQGRIRVPLSRDRRPTDWERNVAGLQDAVWATADLAYRRSSLEAVGGFDERFPRAYREDSELALRLATAGYRIVRGERATLHPVGQADRWVSLRKQIGNADDALMAALHGAGWRERAGAPRGRLRRHVATAAAAALTVTAACARRQRVAAAAGLAWAGGTAELAWARIAPGPRTPDELATMLITSAAIPFAATWHRVRGELRARRLARGGPLAVPSPTPAAVLLDRDGTLIADVPYNGDPNLVEPLPGAPEALERLRASGCSVALVTNQSGIGRGLLRREQVEAVNARVEELLGPFDAVRYCPHLPEDHCECRKPAPGMLLDVARELGVAPERCAMVGDIGADVEATLAAGMRAVLVPTARTRRTEVASAPEVAGTLDEAVDRLLGVRAAAPELAKAAA
jgi:HAD superfamily hydrolase (TIGR01662 family)